MDLRPQSTIFQRWNFPPRNEATIPPRVTLAPIYIHPIYARPWRFLNCVNAFETLPHGLRGRPRHSGGITYPFPRLVVQRTSHVDGARHVLDGESAPYVTARDLVSNTWCWNKKGTFTYTLSTTSVRENQGGDRGRAIPSGRRFCER